MSDHVAKGAEIADRVPGLDRVQRDDLARRIGAALRSAYAAGVEDAARVVEECAEISTHKLIGGGMRTNGGKEREHAVARRVRELSCARERIGQ